MTSIAIDPHIRPRIQPDYFCRNSQLPSAHYQGLVSSAVNRVARHRPKELFRSNGDCTSIVENVVWRFAGHVGPMAAKIVVRARMALAQQSKPEITPGLQLDLVDGAGSPLASRVVRYGYSWGFAPLDVPDEWGTVTIAVDATAFRDTSVRGTLTAVEEGRPISATVYEYSLPGDSIWGYTAQQYSIGAPILDGDRQGAQDLAVSLYKRGAAPLFAYSSRTDATAPTNVQATYRNVIDNTAGTSRTSQTPGFTLDLSFCNRKMATTVPCRMEVYASQVSGGPGGVRIVDLAGTVYATIAIAGAGAWQQTTVNLPADNRIYFVEHVGDGLNAVKTHAVSVYQYIA